MSAHMRGEQKDRTVMLDGEDVKSIRYKATDGSYLWDVEITWDNGAVCTIGCVDGRHARALWGQLNNASHIEYDTPIRDTEYDQTSATVAMQAERDQLAAALCELLDWGRAHTSPTDDNSPHRLLVNAAELLRSMGLRK